MSDKRFIPPFSSPGEFHAIEEEKIGRERKQKKQSKNTPHTLVFSKKNEKRKTSLAFPKTPPPPPKKHLYPTSFIPFLAQQATPIPSYISTTFFLFFPPQHD
jgi:hypothetical protein